MDETRAAIDDVPQPEPTTSLATTGQNSIASTILGAPTPRDMVTAASEMASELAKVIDNQKLFTDINGKKYVHVDGWTTMIAMLGIVPREIKVVSLKEGFIAYVELVRISDGTVLGRGSALCGTDESKWADRPDYARRSMAITRATGKACRLAFGWIMSLAGYESTPKEEMDSLEKRSQPQATRPVTQAAAPPAPQAATQPEPPTQGGAAQDSAVALRVEITRMLREMCDDNNQEIKNALIGYSSFVSPRTGDTISCSNLEQAKAGWLNTIYGKVRPAYIQWKELDDAERVAGATVAPSDVPF